MTITQKLSVELRARKLRQRNVGKIVGMTERQLSNIMHGSRKLRADELLEICLIADIDPAVFLHCDELAPLRELKARQQEEERQRESRQNEEAESHGR